MLGPVERGVGARAVVTEGGARRGVDADAERDERVEGGHVARVYRRAGVVVTGTAARSVCATTQ